MALSDLSRRVGTALVGAAAFLGAVWGHPAALALAFALIAGFGAYELAALTRGWHRRPPVYAALPAFLLGFAFPLSLGLGALGGLRPAFGGVPLLMLLALALRPDAGNRRAAAVALLGAAWVGLPLALAALLGAAGPWPSAEGHHPELITGVLVLIWANDVGAYFAGSTLGRTKLAPAISPNKSWEGVIGGALLGLGVAAAYAALFGLPMGPWLGLALPVTVFGTLGDLSESRLKRMVGAKDSGILLPGHGGFLDRFDSLLLVAPVAYAWFRWWPPIS